MSRHSAQIMCARQAMSAVPDRPTVQCGGGVGGAAVSDLSFGDHPPCRLLGKGKAGRERLSHSLSPSQLSFLPFFSDKQSLLILPQSDAVLVYMASHSSGSRRSRVGAFTQPELPRSGAL